MNFKELQRLAEQKDVKKSKKLSPTDNFFLLAGIICKTVRVVK